MHAGFPPQPRFRRPPLPGQSAFASQYDARVRQADHFIGQIFAVLRAKGLLDDALVFVTADHGERAGENGLFYRGGLPDRPGTTIPVLVYDASGFAWPARALTSQIDIAPTIMRAIGGDPEPGWTGQPLQDPARIDAVPLGTFEMTGTVAFVDGRQYRYLCTRRTGAETVASVGATADTRMSPSPALLARLRAMHRAVAGPISGKCRR